MFYYLNMYKAYKSLYYELVYYVNLKYILSLFFRGDRDSRMKSYIFDFARKVRHQII